MFVTVLPNEVPGQLYKFFLRLFLDFFVKVHLPLLKHLDQRDEGLFCVIKLDHFFEWDLNTTIL